MQRNIWDVMVRGNPATRNTTAFDTAVSQMTPGSAALLGGRDHIGNAFEISNLLNQRPKTPSAFDTLGNFLSGMGNNAEGTPALLSGQRAALNAFDTASQGGAAADTARNAMFLELLKYGEPKSTGSGGGLGGLGGFPTGEADERSRALLTAMSARARAGEILSPDELAFGSMLYRDLSKATEIDRIDPNDPSQVQNVSIPKYKFEVSPELIDQFAGIGFTPEKVLTSKRRERNEAQRSALNFANTSALAMQPIIDYLDNNEWDNWDAAIAKIPILGKRTELGEALIALQPAVRNQLRALSGAAMTDAERRDLIPLYSPSVGDRPELVKWKIGLLQKLNQDTIANLDWDPNTNPVDLREYYENYKANNPIPGSGGEISGSGNTGNTGNTGGGSNAPILNLDELDLDEEGTGEFEVNDAMDYLMDLIGPNKAHAMSGAPYDLSVLGDMANQGASLVSPETPSYPDQGRLSPQLMAMIEDAIARHEPEWTDLGDGIMRRNLPPHQFAKSPTFEDQGYSHLGNQVWGKELPPLQFANKPALWSEMTGGAPSMVSPETPPSTSPSFFSEMTNGGASLVSPETPPSIQWPGKTMDDAKREQARRDLLDLFQSPMANSGASMMSPETPPNAQWRDLGNGIGSRPLSPIEFANKPATWSDMTGGAPSMVSPEGPGFGGRPAGHSDMSDGAASMVSPETPIAGVRRRQAERAERANRSMPDRFPSNRDNRPATTPVTGSTAVKEARAKGKEAFVALREEFGPSPMSYENLFFMAQFRDLVSHTMTLDEFVKLMKEWGIEE